jgi:hypothetical protein
MTRETHKPAAAVDSFTIVACPQLVGHVGKANAGWLGAAAASIACIRAQAQMGGRAASTRIPAELLGLSPVPVDNYPIDPFEIETARQREIDAVGNAAWIDGEITFDNRTFEVTLVLRSNQRELARGKAKGTHLLTTIRDAMEPLEPRIPQAANDDAFLLAWTGARTPAAAVALTDYALVRQMDNTDGECKRIGARTDFDPATARIIHTYCNPPPPSAPWQPTPIDTSSPAALRKSLEIDPHMERRSLDDDLPAIDAALAKTTDHEERSFLLAQKSALLTIHGKGDEATTVGLLAIQESPKALDLFDNPWAVLSFLHSATNLPPASNAWVPWSVEAYCMTGTQTTDPEVRIQSARRDHILSTEELWAANLVEFLIAGGRRDEAVVVATQTTLSATKIWIAAADAKFAKAIELGNELMPSTNNTMDASQMAVYLAKISLITNQPAPAIDVVVNRLVSDQGIGVNDLVLTYNMLVACLVTSKDVAKKCYERLPKLWIGPIAWQEGLLEGAQKFADGDYEGASRAWRPMLARPNWQLDSIRDFVATAFERAHEDDLVERIDKPLLDYPGRFNGGELAYARAARREERRNHPAQAKMWAEKLIVAWGVADTQVPAVAEMRKLVARLR